MSVLHELPKVAPYLNQDCPFCQMSHPIYIQGATTTFDGQEFKTAIFPDTGYSFCNCKNIWYTNWSNIRQDSYDSAYESKHTHKEIEKHSLTYWKMNAEEIVRNGNGGSEFLEIGAINPYILDCAKRQGYETTGLDIFPHREDFGHELIVADFEQLTPSFTFKEHQDVIWASHIFEHFKLPLEALKKCYNTLNPGGILFIAMPDPFFINFSAPYDWAHWHQREHHIMWDAESFVSEAEKIGFKTVWWKRNIVNSTMIFGDAWYLFKKP